MKNPRKRIHIVYPNFLNPVNPISVNLIGAGGTGSQMLTALSRINQALNAIGHAGLQVNVFDDDTVQRANLARQLFTENEVGLNKGVALINRINRFFGTNWKAVPERFENGCKEDQSRSANLTISCVDTVSARIEIEKTIGACRKGGNYRDTPIYLMDFGNSRDSGQAVLSTISNVQQANSENFCTVSSLPSLLGEYSELLTASENGDDTPSCSLAEALVKQDLFINSALANLGASLLWTMLREGVIQYRGFFVNLADFRTQPISV
ncbi:PRTRC system ThiF family protein [Pedobacter miscanthi]|uniref:PRTRC system ThiF family protein n=1 Tax=Pedobacter miscanthi TaxID=2259170 RepID=A0A366LEV7_9SPHI|nr:PRTRC system ThiF family protein [Pedobacter miscanthi]RBQ12019.1 PRTRC system ThiF family protein [Pedobacter miscanthi]